MQDNKVLTDNDFFEKYTCEYNQVIQKDLEKEGDNGTTTMDDMAPYGGCMYETHGEEIEYVVNIANTTPKKVWTIISVDYWEGIVSGYHLVNRLGYLITEEEWEDQNEEYVVYDAREMVEEWEKLPVEALEEVINEKLQDYTEMELGEIREENFCLWESMSEDEREFILNKYKIKNNGNSTTTN